MSRGYIPKRATKKRFWQGDTETKADKRVESDERSGVVRKMKD